MEESFSAVKARLDEGQKGLKREAIILQCGCFMIVWGPLVFPVGLSLTAHH